jgi:RimJ/RimL family protein N-acetyltransferase
MRREKNFVLTGQVIQLEPIKEEHRNSLKLLSQDDRVSTYSPALKLKFDSWFDKALKALPEQLTFIVRHLKNQQIIGSTRLYEINFDHKRLTIGYTWYQPDFWGSGVNLDCKLLLLNYAFHILNMNRVEFCVDSRNERSRAAVKKLGAIEEGILRQHIVLEDGYVRDTVIYSILKSEWQKI